MNLWYRAPLGRGQFWSAFALGMGCHLESILFFPPFTPLRQVLHTNESTNQQQRNALVKNASTQRSFFPPFSFRCGSGSWSINFGGLLKFGTCHSSRNVWGWNFWLTFLSPPAQTQGRERAWKKKETKNQCVINYAPKGSTLHEVRFGVFIFVECKDKVYEGNVLLQLVCYASERLSFIAKRQPTNERNNVRLFRGNPFCFFVAHDLWPAFSG